MLRLCGAELILVPAVPYKDPNNYVRYSGRLAEELADKERRTARSGPTSSTTSPTAQAHIEGTGPEIWRQTEGKVDAFVSAVGTGGTLAGVGMALKERNPDVVIALADPLGAALYNYYAHGELKAEGNSITEGIGQGRITQNLEGAPVDAWFQIPDEEALPLIFDLVRRRGPGARRLDRHQHRRRDPAGAGRWGRATPSSPCCATTATAIRASCSTPPSCARRVCRCRAGSKD